MNFPIEYQVVEQVHAQSNLLRVILSLRTGTRQINSVPDGFLLVRMHAAPFNPSDIAFLQGSYNVKKPLPAVPGFEGAGTVVAVGAGVDEGWVDSRVACFAGNEGDGTWAEFMLARTTQLIRVSGDLSWDQIATFLVNPYTAHALFQLALNDGAEAIAINAAGSRLADWLRLFAARIGLETINIVRKPQTAEFLIKKGCHYVLVSSDQDFTERYRTLTSTLNCRIAFDAVGGSIGGIMLSAMPRDSRLVVYGGLSNQSLCDLDVLELIFKGKQVVGFDLNRWWADNPRDVKTSVANEITQLMKSGEYQGQISQIVELKDVATGLKHYLGHMSEGKVLLRMV